MDLGAICCLAGLSGSECVVGCEEGSVLHLRACEAGWEVVRQLQGHSLAVVSLTVCDNLIFSGSVDGTIRMTDCSTNQTAVLQSHANASLSVTEDNVLRGASLDGLVHEWNVEQGVGVHERDEWNVQASLDRGMNISAVVLHADGSLAIGTTNGVIKYYVF